jgi:hypothetical protein
MKGILLYVSVQKEKYTDSGTNFMRREVARYCNLPKYHSRLPGYTFKTTTLHSTLKIIPSLQMRSQFDSKNFKLPVIPFLVFCIA